MKVIPLESIPLVERTHVREGIFRSRTLLTGAPGTPGNFSLQWVALPGSYKSPRHRHNFDQVRYQLEGEFDFAHDGRMRPGSIAYFPEGTRYGPQTSTAASTTLVLQFGGASGSGYISAEEYARAQNELMQSGSFAGGVYTRGGADGKPINQDAYEAVWEQVNGRALEYPPERYARPVFMEPDHFRWVEQRPGVARRLLGEFSECGTRLAFWRAAAGATLPLEAHAIHFVLGGSGRAGAERYAAQTTLYTSPGEQAAITPDSDSELLEIRLPDL